MCEVLQYPPTDLLLPLQELQIARDAQLRKLVVVPRRVCTLCLQSCRLASERLALKHLYYLNQLIL